MVNCNPETVSTDYDTSDRLFFEPLTAEDVRNVCRRLQERADGDGALAGVIVASAARRRSSSPASSRPPASRSSAPAPTRSTSPRTASGSTRSATASASRSRPGGTVDHHRAGAGRSPTDSATRCSSGRRTCSAAGRCRSSTTTTSSIAAMAELAAEGSLGREGGLSAERPVLVDRFLEDAIEVDVDALRDATGEVVIGGVMEHIEEAGVHSGDSACAIPPQTLTRGDGRARSRRTRARSPTRSTCAGCSTCSTR